MSADTRLYSNIPEELRLRPQWVCYTLEPNRDGDITKIPREPKTGARVRNSEYWTTFEEAIAKVYRYDGIEYMLDADDPFTFIDLDHCVDVETGRANEEAQKIINRFDSYTELSQSGTGIHILARGSKPRDEDGKSSCRSKRHPGIEIYDSARPIVMTGNIYRGKSTIQPCGNEINVFYEQLFGGNNNEQDSKTSKRKSSSATMATSGKLDIDAPDDSRSPSSSTSTVCTGEPLSDIEVIEKATKRATDFAALYAGDNSSCEYDDSSADLALCNILAFWTGKNADQMDRLFRQSGLFRDKWDSRRPGGTYGSQTIAKAIKDTKNAYTPRPITAKPKSSSNSKSKRPSSSQPISISTSDNTLSSLTDLGNAEAMISIYGEDIHYDVDSGFWLHWDGTRWFRDDTGAIDRMACSTIRSLYDYLPSISDPDKAKALVSHIKKSEQRPRVEGMIKSARTLDGVPIKTYNMDADQWKLNCLNGTVDLHTGELYSHLQSDLISKQIPVNYDPTAKCPRWMQFLDEVFNGDRELVGFIRRMIGYCITGDTREESVFILYGRGQCGKSKLIEVLRNILGDYIKDTPVSTFVERNDTNTADLASLVGARMVTASEAEEDQVFNEALLKKISGRDPITCRHLYKNFFTYEPTFKVVFATNDVPRIKSQSFAMKRRIKIVPFRQRFYDPEDGKLPVKDDTLGAKLANESPGILAWAVQGCLEWQRDGLKVPDVVRSEINALFESQDPLGEFIEDMCRMDASLSVRTSDLWREYVRWCDEKHQNTAFKHVSSFSRSLVKRDDIESGRDPIGGRILKGIGFLTGKTDKEPIPKSVPCEEIHEKLSRNSHLPVYPSNERESKNDELDWYQIDDEKGL